MARELRFGEKTLVLLLGDITEQKVDTIVNAANEWLIHGGGVALAIARKAGPRLTEECAGKGPVPVGQAVITTGGRLPARFVIHAVGPRGGDPDGDDRLRNAVSNSLALAEEHGVRSIAFPAISAGIFHYPLPAVARIHTEICAAWLGDPAHGIREIRLVLFDEPTLAAFEAALDRVATG